MSELKLDGTLVKDVSRSFYLTLRLLPDCMREVISLGYLLARASDTIADSTSVPVEVRQNDLDSLMEAVKKGRGAVALEESYQGLENEGEQVLMANLDACVNAISRFDDAEQGALKKVIQTITTGQGWDMTYFTQGEITQVSDESLLDWYTYSVAGCVGEFWTEVLAIHGYLRKEEVAEMKEAGILYGKGLQLTNIIRDIPEDLKKGRIYIPKVEPTLEQVISGTERWIGKAEGYLQEGIGYCRRLPHGRVKFATELPALLGIKTLELIQNSSLEERKVKVKVSRKMVLQQLFQTMLSL